MAISLENFRYLAGRLMDDVKRTLEKAEFTPDQSEPVLSLAVPTISFTSEQTGQSVYLCLYLAMAEDSEKISAIAEQFKSLSTL